MREVSLRATIVTGGALLGLWAASWALSAVPLGAWSIAVALGIAVVKALLVVMIFMELLVEGTSVHVALAAAVAMIAIMIGFMVLDVQSRWTPPLEPPAARALTRQG